MADATREAKDLHDANTENWYKLHKGDKEFNAKRKIAKNGIFASNYGAGAKRVALTLNISIAEATEILNAVNSNLPLDELKSIFWQTLSVSRDIRPIRKGYASYTSGVFYDCMGVRHFYPDIMSRDRWSKQSAQRESFNALMQGGCASIFFSLCTKLLNEVVTPHLGWIAATVHDEVIFYVPTPYAETALVGANKIFNELVLPTPKGGVNVRADFKIVNSWGEK
jgi:DNA polymerase I-like protein with 3'-5' exonuclease and polymerase domains